MNVPLIIIFSILVIALVVWIIKVNRKEKKHLVEKLNKDYPVHDKHEENNDPEDVKSL